MDKVPVDDTVLLGALEDTDGHHVFVTAATYTLDVGVWLFFTYVNRHSLHQLSLELNAPDHSKIPEKYVVLVERAPP